MSETQINWKAIVLYGVIGAVVVLAILYFMKLEPIYTTFNSAGAAISGATKGFDFVGSINGLLDWIQKNPLITSLVAFLGTTAAGYIIKNWQTNKLLDKTVQEYNEQKTMSQQKINDLTATVTGQAEQITNKTSELEMYTNDKTAEILQTRIDEMQTGYERQITDLKRMLAEKEQELKARPFVEVPTIK